MGTPRGAALGCTRGPWEAAGQRPGPRWQRPPGGWYGRTGFTLSHALGGPCFLLQCSCLCSSTAACGPMPLSPRTASLARRPRSGKDRTVPAHRSWAAPGSRARGPFSLRPEAREAGHHSSLPPQAESCWVLTAGTLAAGLFSRRGGLDTAPAGTWATCSPKHGPSC